MLTFPQLNCLNTYMRCKKKAGVGVILLTSFFTLWLHLNLMLYRSKNFSDKVLVASNSSTDDSVDLQAEQILDFSSRLHIRSFENGSRWPRPQLQMVSALSDPIVSRSTSTPAFQRESDLAGIHTYLSHLRGHPEYLSPAVKVTQNREGVKLIIGVPTVKRHKNGYLISMLNSLLSSLSHNESRDCLIIVFIAEPWNTTFVSDLTVTLQKLYPVQIASGLMDIIAPRPEFYPNLDDLPLTFDDSAERVKWRAKQNLDYVYLMLHTYMRGQYYIQLEDDVITKPGFFMHIMRALTQLEDYWLVLKFSPLGFIGKLFHATDLPFVAEFLLMFYSDKPGDWLLDNIATTRVCGKHLVWKECLTRVNKIAVDIQPSLFQHIGYHSSLKGKIQLLKDRSFQLHPNGQERKEAMKTNNNPTPTNIKTTIKEYHSYSIDSAYTGTSMFWGIRPKANDVIDFVYKPAINITRYKLVSGVKSNPNDLFPVDTTVEVSVENVKTAAQNQSLIGPLKFQTVGHFNDRGVAEATLPANIGNIEVFRIHVNSNMTSWVIISNVCSFPFILSANVHRENARCVIVIVLQISITVG